MPTTSEMYERGAADAERGEFNPFYYQHYYYYRQGYDSVRRRNRPGIHRVGILLISGIGVVVLAALVWLIGRVGSAVVAQPVASLTTVATTPQPSPIPPTPTPLPSPTPIPTVAPPTLQVGGRAVVVNVGKAALRLRASPGLTARVIARIPAGREVVLLEGPIEVDGYTWWRVEVGSQSGWCAVATPDGLTFLEPVAP